MEDEVQDLSGISDDELERMALGGDEDANPEGAQDPSTSTQEPAASPPAQPPAPAAEATPQGAPGNDQQPERDRGDLSVALRQERERRQQYEALFRDPNALAQVAAQMGLQVVQPQAEQPEFFDTELAQFTQQQIEGMRGEFGQQMQAMRVEMSRELARQALPDFEDTMQALVKLGDDPVLGPIVQAADRQFANHPNPAMAFYQLGKRLTASAPPSEEAVKAQAQVLAQQMVAEAMGKQQQPLAGPNGLSRAGSVTPGVEKAKDPRQMTDEELDRITNGD
jgi:hypothetical protein